MPQAFVAAISGSFVNIKMQSFFIRQKNNNQVIDAQLCCQK